MSSEFQIDWDRQRRTGVPEAIFCQPKMPAQIDAIVAACCGRRLLLTRLSAAAHQALAPETRALLDYDPFSGTAVLGGIAALTNSGIGIVAAGTSDLPVAREAERTLVFAGHRADIVADVGVAGLWRLLDRLDGLRECRVLIAVAGMEGALFSVLAGLVRAPVIAVPTSVGYGVAEGGKTALFAALTGCAPGVVAVNIDNGFGAAVAALKMLQADPSGSPASYPIHEIQVRHHAVGTSWYDKNSLYAGLKTALRAGAGPDVSYAENDPAEYIDDDFLLDLTDYPVLLTIWDSFFKVLPNRPLHFMGLTNSRCCAWPGRPTWPGDPEVALPALILVTTWMWTGFNMIVSLAAFHSLPRGVLEAAEPDHCGWMKKLRFIIIPLLRPTILSLSILSFVGKMKVFDLVWVTTRGGPFWATETVSAYVYKRAFDLGYPSAIACVWFVIVLIAVMPLSAIFR